MLKFAATAFVFWALAFSAFAFPHGGGASFNASSSPSTIFVPFASSSSANALACGTSRGSITKNAVDNGVTSATRIVAGLTPSTSYFCNANGAIFEIATQPQPASTPLVSVTYGTITAATSFQNGGDVYDSCTSSDSTTYFSADDSRGSTGSVNQNMMIAKFTTETPPLVSSDVNTLSNFSPGGGATCNGADNRSPKMYGKFCLAGNIIAAYGRLFASDCTGWSGGSSVVYTSYAGSLLLSQDHGATWANFQAPTTFVAAGPVPSPTSSFMFPTTQLFGSATFVQYGPDDGTVEPGAYRIDNADAYVYLVGTDGNWDNSNVLYLARVPRAKIQNLNSSDYQYYTGGDGTLDANWSSSTSSIAAIYSATGQTSSADIQYMPSTGRYLLFEWYYPTSTSSATSTWVISEAPHPWGPWTAISTQSWNPQAWYHPAVMPKTVAGATPNGNPMTIVFAGDFQDGQTYYKMNSMPITLNTH